MAWNDNDKNKDPWSGRDQSSPPDLSKLFGKMFKKKPAASGGSGGDNNDDIKGIGVIAGFVLLIVLLLWFISGIFIVSPTDQAVVLRFGDYH